MKSGLRIALVVLISLAASGRSVAREAAGRAGETRGWPGVRHVVLIGVDGLAGDAVDMAPTPHLHALMARGAYTLKARNVLPTSSSSNWKSMISGAAVEAHGVTSNDWQVSDHTLLPWDSGTQGIYPTIFQLFRDSRPDARIAVLFHWDDFARLAEAGSANIYRHYPSAEATTEAAVAAIRDLKPELTFIHLDHVDGAGHGSGWYTPTYFKAVDLADRQIGQIVEALRSADMLDSTLIIVTADHGGTGRSHGGESMTELHIPWIIAGPGIAPSRRIDLPVHTTDTAGTIAGALGFRLASSARGRAVVEVLASTPDAPGVIQTFRHVSRPRFDPPAARFVGESGHVAISTASPGATLRYTLDGSEPTPASSEYTAPLTLTTTTRLRCAAFAGNSRSEVADQTFRVVMPEPGRGASYEVYAGKFTSVTQLSGANVAKSGVSPEICFDDVKPPIESFGAVFKARLRLPATGKYRFWTESDDGSLLKINGKTVVNNDGDHGPKLRGGEVEISQPDPLIEVLYFNGGGSGMLTVYFAGADGKRHILTHQYLEPVELR